MDEEKYRKLLSLTPKSDRCEHLLDFMGKRIQELWESIKPDEPLPRRDCGVIDLEYPLEPSRQPGVKIGSSLWQILRWAERTPLDKVFLEYGHDPAIKKLLYVWEIYLNPDLNDMIKKYINKKK